MSTKAKFVLFLIVKVIFGIVSGKLSVIKIIVVNFEETTILLSRFNISVVLLSKGLYTEAATGGVL